MRDLRDLQAAAAASSSVDSSGLGSGSGMKVGGALGRQIQRQLEALAALESDPFENIADIEPLSSGQSTAGAAADSPVAAPASGGGRKVQSLTSASKRVVKNTQKAKQLLGGKKGRRGKRKVKTVSRRKASQKKKQ